MCEEPYAQEERTMGDESKDARARAEAKFAKAEKAALEGARAKAQYDAEAQAVRDKTSRLRTARLAKEAAEIEAGTGTIKKPATRRKKPTSR